MKETYMGTNYAPYKLNTKRGKTRPWDSTVLNKGVRMVNGKYIDSNIHTLNVLTY
jgi:hypothetical protein